MYESNYITNYEPGGVLAFSLWDRYGVSLYWSLTTVVTVGYGDITPKNKYETGIAMLTMLIAGMVFAFNVSAIRETMTELNASRV